MNHKHKVEDKRCSKCKQIKSIMEFYKGHLLCKECHRSYYCKRYTEDVEYRRRIKSQNKKWREKESNKKHKLNYQKKWREEKKRQLEKFLGNKCIICNLKKNRMCFHEVRGKKHSENLNYILHNYKNFVRLCQGCHANLHYLGRNNINIKIIIKLLRKLVLG